MTEMIETLGAEQLPVRIEGLSAWTDAALLNEAGIPAICFGPGDIALAHSATEYAPVAEIDTATRVLTRFVETWCNERS
jgi:acetylornithine deacetylase/succinyl-diaminopimelate desuccinylase-like protein